MTTLVMRRESFYAELEGKAITEESIKEALYSAVLSNQVVVAVKEVQSFYSADTSRQKLHRVRGKQGIESHY